MFVFEDGTLVKNGYVTINGVEYPVTMPEYSGNTPITAENLNMMQRDRILFIVIPSGTTITDGYMIEWEKGFNYICGSNDLKVYWNGVLLKKAIGDEDGHYLEGGEYGEECGYITLHRTDEDGNYTLTEDVLMTIVIKGG